MQMEFQQQQHCNQPFLMRLLSSVILAVILCGCVTVNNYRYASPAQTKSSEPADDKEWISKGANDLLELKQIPYFPSEKMPIPLPFQYIKPDFTVPYKYEKNDPLHFNNLQFIIITDTL